MQWELLFDYLLAHCIPPTALKTSTSEALVKTLEARAVEAGLPGTFLDKLTAFDNQHNLDISMARPIAINKALHIQTLFRNKPSVKRVKLAEAGKGMLGAAAIQSLLSPESAAGLALTHKVQESGPQSVVEQLFVMKVPESTWSTQNLVNTDFNEEQVAAKLGINKTDVTFAQQLSRASGVPGAVCPDRGHVLREMQSGLTDAIGEKADTFAEGSSLRIETWPSRAHSASPSVFSAVEVPQSVCETIRTGALAGLHSFAITVQLAEKLDIWNGLWQYKSGTSNAQAPMGPVETQHFVQDCWESFLGPLWDAVTGLDREGQGSGRRIAYMLSRMRNLRLPERFIQEFFVRHFLEIEKSTRAFISGFGSTHRQLGVLGNKLQKEVDESISAAKAAHNYSRYLRLAAGPAQTGARPTVEATTPEREKQTSPGTEQRAKKTARTQPAESDSGMGAWIAALQVVGKVRFGTAPTDGGKRPCASMMRLGSCPNSECNYSHNMGFWADKGISKDTVEQKAATKPR